MISVTSLALVTACADSEEGDCSFTLDESGERVLSCNDGTIVPLQPQSCTVSENDDGSATIDCDDGTSFVVSSGVDGEDGTACTVADNGDGTSTISCDDGTTATVSNGADGADGSSCTVADNGDDTTTISCEDGTTATVSNGADGADGSSCSASDNGDGTYTIACDDGSTVTVSDGATGADGSSCSVADNGDGTTTISCGDGTSTTFTTCQLGSSRCVDSGTFEVCEPGGYGAQVSCGTGEACNMGVCFAGLRLVNGGTENQGRVEVYHSGQWGTVCDDFWDLNDARVVCRQLGYSDASSAPQNAAFGQGVDPIWMDNVQCSGAEATLFDCPFNGFGVHNCIHFEDASAVCVP